MASSCTYLESSDFLERVWNDINQRDFKDTDGYFDDRISQADKERLLDEYDVETIGEISIKDTVHGVDNISRQVVVTGWLEKQDIPTKCPHEVGDSHEFCIFHRPVDQKSDEDVSSKFVNKILSGDKEEKTFVGARFGKLDIEYVVLDAKDNYPIRLDYSTISNEFSLQTVVIEQPLIAQSAKFQYVVFDTTKFDASVQFTQSTFHAGIDTTDLKFNSDAGFGGCTFEGNADFHGVVFNDYVNLSAKFCVECDFAWSSFEGEAAFWGATFDGEISFYRATFKQPARFAYVDFNGSLRFDEARFEHIVDFKNTTFNKECNFEDADFAEDAIFGAEYEGAEFNSSVSFQNTTFSDAAKFVEASFQESASFDYSLFKYKAIFNDCDFVGRAYFNNTTFEGDAIFERVDFYEKANFGGPATRVVFEDYVNFIGTTFENQAWFQSTDFKGDTVFSSTFEDDAFFSETTFEGSLSFEGVTVRGTAYFNDSEFYDEVLFGSDVDEHTVTFHSGLGLNRAQFHGLVTFLGSKIKEGISCRDTTFLDDAVFDKVEINGESVFDDVEFRGEVSFELIDLGDSCSFEGARFYSHVDFTRARFHNTITFENAEFVATVDFDETRSTNEIKLVDTTVNAGTVRQPPNETTFYNATGAWLGDVNLEPHNDSKLLDIFRFRETTFEGVDFAKYRSALAPDWKIHEYTYQNSPDSEDNSHMIQRIIPAEMVCDSSIVNQLETTYLKAKNGAKEVGDGKSASEFFLKEMRYRRLGHWYRRNPIRWVINLFYYLTCGYGERPSYVISSSVTIIFGFALTYWIFNIELSSGTSLLHYLLLSSRLFVTLILGSLPSQSSLMFQFLAAFEGFVGAFFIALFVFTLTRSIHR